MHFAKYRISINKESLMSYEVGFEEEACKYCPNSNWSMGPFPASRMRRCFI